MAPAGGDDGRPLGQAFIGDGVEQFGLLLRVGAEAKIIKNQEVDGTRPLPQGLHPAGPQVVPHQGEQLMGFGEMHRVAALASLVADGLGDKRFAVMESFT